MKPYLGKEYFEQYEEKIIELADKHELCIFEVEDVLKIAREDYGAETFEDQVRIAEVEILSNM